MNEKLSQFKIDPYLLEQELLEDRHTLLSILLELTVSASKLFDPNCPICNFLERVAERLNCLAVLCIEVEIEDSIHVRLLDSIGLSHSSKSVPLVCLDSEWRGEFSGKPPIGIYYRELMRPDLKLWSFTIPGQESLKKSQVIHYLQLYFTGDEEPRAQLRGLFDRVVLVLENALSHRRLYQEVIEKKTLLEVQSECTMEGILIVSFDRKVQFVNQRFIEMWGISPKVNQSFRAEYVNDLREKLEDPNALFLDLDVAAFDSDSRTKTELRLKNGKVFECLNVPIKASREFYFGRGWYFKDITEEKENEKERLTLLKREVRARAEAEAEKNKIQKALSVRDEFISIASHELKTPVTSLRLQLQLMQKTLQELSYQDSVSNQFYVHLLKLLKTSDQQVDRLTRLIMSLLDVSRIQAGKLVLELKETNLSQLVFEILHRFDEQFLVSGNKVRVTVEPNIIGVWDPYRIEQVINNLIVNAMKYGAGKPIDIELKRVDGFVELSVRDYGIGIREDQQEQIFKKYERVSSLDHVTGLGLGLYIVKKIIESHQGNIRVESSLEKGALFIVTLPFVSQI